MSETRVRWTEHEERDLASKLFERWKKVPFDAFTKIYDWVMANDWPQDRRRKIVSLVSVPETQKAFTKLVREVLERQVAPQTEVVSESALDLVPLLKTLVVEKPVAYDPTAFLRAQPSEVLLQELSARESANNAIILERLQRIEDLLIQRNKQPQPAVSRPSAQPAPLAIPRKTKPVIAVLGLLPDQFHHVENAIGDRAELRFIKNEGVTDARNFTARADYAVINTKFISHQQRIALQDAKIAHVEFCEGGVQTVTQTVFDILSRQ